MWLSVNFRVVNLLLKVPVITAKCVHGMMHPEGGHVRIALNPPLSRPITTISPVFVSIPPRELPRRRTLHKRRAIREERLNLASVHALKDLQYRRDPECGTDLVGGYLGDFCANLLLTESVERIIIGGGICEHAILMDKI